MNNYIVKHTFVSNEFVFVYLYDIVNNYNIIGKAKILLKDKSLWNFKITENKRHRGFGKLLMRETIKIFRNTLKSAKITLYVEVENTIAKHLYETFGFQIICTEEMYGKNAYKMELTL